MLPLYFSAETTQKISLKLLQIFVCIHFTGLSVILQALYLPYTGHLNTFEGAIKLILILKVIVISQNEANNVFAPKYFLEASYRITKVCYKKE